MRAFVLSGGGNRGPLEVGAVQALLKHGITPEMIVGSSAGALNGAFLAIDPTLQQAEHSAALWRDAGRHKLLKTSFAGMLARFMRGKDFFTDTKKLRSYIKTVLPPQVKTFGDLRVPLWVTITHLVSSTLYVYGDDPAADLVDAVMLSAAVPGVFPPLRFEGELFVDGGVTSNLPVLLAMARGATEIWAIDLAYRGNLARKLSGGLSIAFYPAKAMLHQTVLRELEHAVGMPGITLHHIPLFSHQEVELGDFSKVDEMVAEGERVANAYLQAPRPNQINYGEQTAALPRGPTGAQPFDVQQFMRSLR
jgi:NTE family protein